MTTSKKQSGTPMQFSQMFPSNRGPWWWVALNA